VGIKIEMFVWYLCKSVNLRPQMRSVLFTYCLVIAISLFLVGSNSNSGLNENSAGKTSIAALSESGFAATTDICVDKKSTGTPHSFGPFLISNIQNNPTTGFYSEITALGESQKRTHSQFTPILKI